MLDGVDLSADIKKEIPDFECLRNRLTPFDKADYDSIVNSSTPFEDPHFPVGKDMLLDKTMSHQGLSKWESFVFKRPSEVYGEGNFGLYEEIEPHDIQQGGLGDCYFLSSLASLAEFPERVKRIFVTKEVNKAGCYAVEMIIAGELRTIVVDDRFPYNERTGKWAFSRPSLSKQIWVLVLEKVWAKVFGSY
jgi:calpain-15